MQTEITVQVFEELEEIIEKLEYLGYKKEDYLKGKDYYFASLKNEDIRESSYKNLIDNSLIIRSFFIESKNICSNLMTYKHKIQDKNGNVISEEKTQTTIGDKENTLKILSNIGLNNFVTLEQENYFYSNGEIQVIVGRVNGLEGCFIEIEEYPSIAKKSKEEKFDILCEKVNSFNFKHGTDYSCKKVYMLLNKKTQI